MSIQTDRYGEIDYMESGDALAVRHNLRVDAMRFLDAAGRNRASGDPIQVDIARRQTRTAHNLLEDARLAR